jgi:hypothetical protein
VANGKAFNLNRFNGARGYIYSAASAMPIRDCHAFPSLTVGDTVHKVTASIPGMVMRRRMLAIVPLIALIVILIAAVAITLSHETFPMSGVGTLKCYTAQMQHPC